MNYTFNTCALVIDVRDYCKDIEMKVNVLIPIMYVVNFVLYMIGIFLLKKEKTRKIGEFIVDFVFVVNFVISTFYIQVYYWKR